MHLSTGTIFTLRLVRTIAQSIKWAARLSERADRPCVWYDDYESHYDYQIVKKTHEHCKHWISRKKSASYIYQHSAIRLCIRNRY